MSSVIINAVESFGNCYLYRYIRNDKNEPFYIGIGTKNKDDLLYGTYSRATGRKYNKNWQEIVDNVPFTVEILMEANDYEFIKEKEKEFIALHGRFCKNTGTLVNLTAGGQGVRDYTPTLETRKKMSEAQKGRKQSVETKEKKRLLFLGKNNPNWGKSISKEHKEILRKAQLGRKQSQETKEKRAIKLKKKIINVSTGEVFHSVSEAIKSIEVVQGISYRAADYRLHTQLKKKDGIFKYLSEKIHIL